MPSHDPASVNGATLPVAERTELLVIGAGHAGLAAALAAASAGQTVTLIDENPVPAESMAEDVPQFFGGRVSPAARNRTAMLEAFIASDPRIEQAFDAGIDLRLGTTCWGLYANGPALGWMPGPVAGLSDGTRAWLLAADRIVVATGRRDMALAFDGWAQPGVMGMEAATRLATRYGALAARRAVVLGTAAEAIAGAATLAAAGVEIAALVEPGPTPLDDATPFPILCRQTVCGAESGPDGVTALLLSGPGGDTRIPCDTIILAVAAIPLIELLDSATCRTHYDPARGGHVPLLGPAGQTTVPAISAAGDCAGVWPAKSRDPAIAAEEGRRAALGQPAPPAPIPTTDPGQYRLDWVRSTVLAAAADPHVCQCEEVTAREILEVRPPRYLGAHPRRNSHDLHALLGAGTPNPDHVKRLTRAGMGLCQGRRCRDQVAALLALASNLPLADIPMATHRAPVRPLPLRLAAGAPEDPVITENWDVWFRMRSQYRAFWDLPAKHTVATRE